MIRNIKCILGFHNWGRFWKDGWIAPTLISREHRKCTFCGCVQYREKS